MNPNQVKSWCDILDTLKERSAMPGRVLLYGPPGTGKSTWPALNYPRVERLPLTPGTDKEEILGCYQLHAGETSFMPGPAPRAMIHGIPLVIDEIDRMGPDIEAILHAILDDPTILSLTLPDGTVHKPKAGFRVFATTNENPAVLPPAILDRFDSFIHCRMPAPGALAKIKHAGLGALVCNHYTSLDAIAFAAPLSFRRCLSFSSLSEKLQDPELAALCALGDLEAGREMISCLASADAGTVAVGK